MADWLLLLQINSKRWRFTSERKKELKIKTSNLSDRRNDPLWPRACPRWKSLRLLHNIGKFGQRFHLQRQVITQWEVSASISDKEWVIMLRSGPPKNQGLVSIFSFDGMNLKSTERKSIFRISSLDFHKKNSFYPRQWLVCNQGRDSNSGSAYEEDASKWFWMFTKDLVKCIFKAHDQTLKATEVILFILINSLSQERLN